MQYFVPDAHHRYARTPGSTAPSTNPYAMSFLNIKSGPVAGLALFAARVLAAVLVATLADLKDD